MVVKRKVENTSIITAIVVQVVLEMKVAVALDPVKDLVSNKNLMLVIPLFGTSMGTVVAVVQ
jgi:hypothetical protein